MGLEIESWNWKTAGQPFSYSSFKFQAQVATLGSRSRHRSVEAPHRSLWFSGMLRAWPWPDCVDKNHVRRVCAGNCDDEAMPATYYLTHWR